ncbi:hypothetical protein Pelo_19738 [Pelomyxa schiedti]|nr:hypothetical protein Pelo_19738 [Pelomyxa schiedti]
MKRWNVFTLKSRNKPELDFSITDADLLRLLHCGVIIWPCYNAEGIETPDIKLERVQAGADTQAGAAASCQHPRPQGEYESPFFICL